VKPTFRSARVPALLGAEHPRLLLRVADEQDAFLPVEGGQVLMRDGVLVLALAEFPGSSPELKGARREHEGTAQRFSRDYPRVEGELGAAA
jgi:hypothetical protein